MDWNWLFDLKLRAFCHLQPQRSFAYGENLHSLLCHRCTGIYSGFLLAWAYGLAFQWKGKWGRNPLWFQLMIGVVFLCFSGIQVYLEETWGPSALTDWKLRFLLGCLAGLSLRQMTFLMTDIPQKGPAWWTLAMFPLMVLVHGFLSMNSFFWASLTSLIGLIWLYWCVNHALVIANFPKCKNAHMLILLPLIIAGEWALLYWINTGGLS